MPDQGVPDPEVLMNALGSLAESKVALEANYAIAQAEIERLHGLLEQAAQKIEESLANEEEPE